MYDSGYHIECTVIDVGGFLDDRPSNRQRFEKAYSAVSEWFIFGYAISRAN